MVNPFILQATDAMTQIILGIHTLLLGTDESPNDFYQNH